MIQLWLPKVKNLTLGRAVVVTHLAEPFLLTPEVHSSNPVIGNFYFLLTEPNQKTKAEKWPFKKAPSVVAFQQKARSM